MDLAEAQRRTPWLNDTFFSELSALSARKRISPYDLALVLIGESRLKPDAFNTRPPTAHGIFQAIPSTLRTLGWTSAPEVFRSLSAAAQLPYLERYIDNVMREHHVISWPSAAHYYAANFLPMTVGRGDGIVASGSASSGAERAAYNNNSSFDSDGKGYITLGDLNRYLDARKRETLYQAVSLRIADAEQGRPSGLVAAHGTLNKVAQAAKAITIGGLLGIGGYFLYSRRKRS